MDMKEGSAMTEASGLTNEQDGIEQTSDTRRRPLPSSSQDAANTRWVQGGDTCKAQISAA
jgi:hypothetical protein